MARREKLPWAPWNDSWKWGNPENWASKAVVDEWVAKDPRVDGHVVLLERESDPYTDDPDPYAFVDGDDVRCPETGDVHPGFVAILEDLGLSYADVSVSGTGVHALYEGRLPDGYKQAVFDVDDEPWGGNETPPTVEIYDGKHVCVVTGQHVPGTPLEITAWDDDALAVILDEHVRVEDRQPPPPEYDSMRRDSVVDGSREFDKPRAEIHSVFEAIDRLQPGDLSLRTRQVGTDTTGWEQWDPSTYRTSSGGDSLHRQPEEGVFYDHKTGRSFGLLGLFAAEEGIIQQPWHPLDGAAFWQAVNAAREAGAPIPESSSTPEPFALLPEDDRLFGPTTGWDWRHAGRDRGDLTIQAARDRTQAAIADAYKRGDQVLVEALPTMGKTTGAIRAAAEIGQPITYLCPRREVMAEVAEKARDADLDFYALPAFPRHCDTANGEHGEHWQETVRDWYRRGASPKDIHAHAEYELGRPLPCQEHEGQECPYTSMWRFEPDEFDVLIGHYVHGHKPKVTLSERQVRTHLNTLADRGYLTRTAEGRGYVWSDDGLHRVNDHGAVEIDVVEDAETVAEVSRMSTYTWEFRNSPGDTGEDRADQPATVDGAPTDTGRERTGGGLPPL